MTSSADVASPPCSADPELFFPVSVRDVEQVEAARAVCETCPLARPCLAYALSHAVHGVWAGTTEADRADLQRRHGLPRRVPSAAALAAEEHQQHDEHAPSDFDDSEA